MRGKVKQALREDRLLKVDASTRQQARQPDTLADLYALQSPISLDLLLDEDDPDSSLLEALVAQYLSNKRKGGQPRQRKILSGILHREL
jgi:hypothetical protein